MDDQLYKEAMYVGFFDELGLLEKQQLLEKNARVGLLRQIGSGFSRIGRRGVGGTATRLEKAYRTGAGRAGNLMDPKAKFQGARKALGGIGSVMRTREGKALAAAGLGGAAAVGGAGMAAGYGAGRLQGQNQ